jgi:hypothetical protein
MRYAYAVLLVILVSVGGISAAASVSAAPPYEVFFDDDEDIKVTFPNGNTVDESGTLVFKARSDKYDLQASSIYFFKADSGKVPDFSDMITYLSSEIKEKEHGRTVTYTIHNIRESFKIDFTDLVLAPEGVWPEDDIEDENVEPEPEDLPKTVNKMSEDDDTLILMSLAVVIAAALLVFSAYNLSIVNAALKKAGGKTK